MIVLFSPLAVSAQYGHNSIERSFEKWRLIEKGIKTGALTKRADNKWHFLMDPEKRKVAISDDQIISIKKYDKTRTLFKTNSRHYRKILVENVSSSKIAKLR